MAKYPSLPAHMRKYVHATRQFHYQWCSGQWHVKHAENAASVHHTCLDKNRLLFTKNIERETEIETTSK